MSSHEHLSAASNDRKARLAQLKSLKRKQAPSDDTADDNNNNNNNNSTTTTDSPSTALTTTEPADSHSVATAYLSGRNFDTTTRNVKLGFDTTPISNPESTLEYKAAQLALATKTAQESDKDDAPLDLFKLQPKKPNWDLKRDLEEKMRTGGLERGTENAIARLVRERVEGQKRERVGRKAAGSGEGDGEGEGEGEEVGIEGGELVEAMHQREVEEERERRRDEAEDAAVEG
ncbi:cwf18 pre-mRNA splicing factor [Stagonosporopsis vannaccii]|nr:cwf18 pre-mRNA splicing factor [Stagonosporopsis vannaccii]